VIRGGGRIRRGAAASTSATVQVEYKGTFTTTYNQTLDANPESMKKNVATVTWDFVWTGTLDQLLSPFIYSKATTKLVTITIGGNDTGIIGALID